MQISANLFDLKSNPVTIQAPEKSSKCEVITRAPFANEGADHERIDPLQLGNVQQLDDYEGQLGRGSRDNSRVWFQTLITFCIIYEYTLNKYTIFIKPYSFFVEFYISKNQWFRCQ